MADDTSFTSIIPVLSARSVDASIEYYTTVLGFDKDWDWPLEDGEKTFGSVSRGAVTVFFNKRKDQEDRPFCVYYYVEDVDKLNEVYKAAGANISEEPTDKPWRMREMLVADPDGHVLRIGSSLEHDDGGGGSGVASLKSNAEVVGYSRVAPAGLTHKVCSAP